MEFVNETDKLDQHFLIDKEVIQKFIETASLNKDDTIVEIGPGKGNISSLIAPKVAKLYLIEKDERLKPYLSRIALANGNVEVIYDNVLDVFIPTCNKIITSLPYSIIEPFIFKTIKCDFEELIMITGSKYADNVINNSRTKLSLLTNCFFKATKIMDILPESFDPKPRVLSSMLKLVKIKEEDLDDVLVIFRNLFFYKDKKTKNALVESFIRFNYLKEINMTQKEAKNIVSSLNLDESLLLKQFCVLSNEELNLIYESLKKFFENT